MLDELYLAKEWVLEAGEQIKVALKNELHVKTKHDRKDIVTQIDVQIQDFLVGKILETYPEDIIMGEENGLNQAEVKGRMWVIDPIDGTLNFYYQKKNFAVMLGFYVDGIGEFGIIYDVMRGDMYWGQKGLGVYCNERKLVQPQGRLIEDALVAMNSFVVQKDILSSKAISKASMGVRSYGSAGIEIISLLNGDTSCYISRLCPWDWASGLVLVKEFGYSAQWRHTGNQPNWDTDGDYVRIAYPKDMETYQ
jgi:myo-inositol-1(or 4)-monophosphatase